HFAVRPLLTLGHDGLLCRQSSSTLSGSADHSPRGIRKAGLPRPHLCRCDSAARMAELRSGMNSAACVIRPATPADLDAVCALLRETWHQVYDPIIGENAVDEIS